MAVTTEVTRYRRAAERRLEDARFLAGGVRERQTGAVYLAGYAAECGLKALLLSVTREADQPDSIYSHSLLALRDACRRAGVNLPREEDRRINDLADWDTTLRYNPGDTDPRDAADFLGKAAALLQFIRRSL